MAKIFLVGTPIGNLKDITFRAIETLKNVDLIACEDTRVTSKLLDYYNIKKRLITYNKINEKASAEGILELIVKDNLNIALVSDAGMPLVSDPGFELIKKARENNIEVELIPGVSASISAFALSGFSNTFIFHGFPEEKSGRRKKQIENLDKNYAHIFYVSPHKFDLFINDIKEVWFDKANLFLARELTKMHESTYFGTPEEIIKSLDNTSRKGEYTIVVKIAQEKNVKINKYKK
ncbi:Ribosomal RNA small subunit methyltransferase I [Mycoplasmopsis maculosa]|uniref:Ribosomal RNA small subunit methyltransferase I n=1 Tax=Mycoplasmopsis maculosa TaxID=114885 RepID=A0A449B4P4_9BACT|nr:16S rRNA (cytidine(1402)-2'-O)-methyltransferase [Mycoplasmopsis maculosa]VEU75577.1 Ribosomal RNA small subunit methyltransferase I [Mycoplasmopsis maculosa]